MKQANRPQARVASEGDAKKTYKSDVLEALHRSASALHKVGAMDAQKHGPDVLR